MSCPTCRGPLAPAWDGSLVCPPCEAGSRNFGHLCQAHPTTVAIGKVARFEAYALERGWTLGELWNTHGWYGARGLVCIVRPEHRVRDCDATAVVLVRVDVLGKEVVSAFRRSPLAARVPVERLTARPLEAA